MKRKYNEYKVVVKYSNGNSKEVSCDSNYKEMIDMYRSAKNEFASNEECMSVEFIGIGEDEVSVMFSKVFQREEEIQEEGSNEVESESGCTYIELMKQVERLTKKMRERRQFLWGELSSLDKKQDKYLHHIENGLDLPIANKIEIFNTINSIRAKRRDVKNEIFMFDRLKPDSILRVNDKIKQIEKMSNNQIEHRKDCRLALNKGYILKKVVKLDTIKSKDNMMSQLNESPKYDKVEYDSTKMAFNCYIKVGK